MIPRSRVERVREAGNGARQRPRGRLWWLAWIGLLAGTATCSEEAAPGGLMLVLETDGSLDARWLQTRVQSLEEQALYLDRGYPVSWTRGSSVPETLALRSRPGQPMAVAIDLTLWRSRSPVATDVPVDVRRYRVKDVPTDRVAELRVVFTADCSRRVNQDTGQSTCEATETCEGGLCVDNGVSAAELPTFRGAGARVEAPWEGGLADSDARSIPERDADGVRDVSTDPSDASSRADARADGRPAVAEGGADRDVRHAPADARADGAGLGCAEGDRRCDGQTPQRCDGNGRWKNQTMCSAGFNHCVSGRCADVPPSCVGDPVDTGAEFDCGRTGALDCCASPLVEGGTFYQSYDGHDYTSRAHEATISTFRLDTFEVTVGRFRNFVEAMVRYGWLPPAGSGKHQHLNQGRGLVVGESDAGPSYEDGWAPAWNAHLPRSFADWDTRLAECGDSGTWDLNVGSERERLPMTCVDWYAAQAFCIWDRGFLPSTAEWNYAAAGGDEQRVYAWGDQAPGGDATLAIWGCRYRPGLACPNVSHLATVGSAPAGNGRWGHSDLTGNVREWNLDWAGWDEAPVLPALCNDCVDMRSEPGRIFRGGTYWTAVEDLPVSYLFWWSRPENPHDDVGIRCARVP